MAAELMVPSLGESVSEAFIAKWHKNDGDFVNANEPLLELETDKANVEIRADKPGNLRILKKQGTVKVGEVIGKIEEAAARPGGSDGASPAGTPAQQAKAAQPQPQATMPVPAAKQAEAASGKAAAPAAAAPAATPSHAPTPVAGTAPAAAAAAAGTTTRRAEPAPSPALRRRIREQGIEAHGETAPAPPAFPSTAASAPAAAPGATAKPAAAADGERRVPMTRLRKRIAERLLEAQRGAAILTTFNEVDMGAVMELRSRLKEKFQEAHKTGLSFVTFFARAVILAVRDVPALNHEIRGEDIVERDFVNLGIAVSTDRGLVVPVVKHAERLSFAELEREVARLAQLARDAKLAPDDLAGGTFTISNGGVFGSLLSTPILNPPQSGILGLHKIEDRPVVKEKQVVIRPMMYVALSYDHRLVDGRESVTFLVRVKERIEDPARLMLEV